MADLTTAIKLYLEAHGLRSGLRGAERGIHGFSRSAKTEIRSIGHAFRGIRGQLATLGVGLGATAVLGHSAELSKRLTEIKHTANATTAQMHQLRQSIFDMAQKTGVPVNNLVAGFGDLVALGMDWKQSIATIKAMNPLLAETGVNAADLAQALSVARVNFDFDLSKTGAAARVLAQMYVAGKKGSAELNKMPSILSRVAATAHRAGLNFKQTLAFIEGMSKANPDPDTLRTLAESTLRLFSNARYLKQAQSATGIHFFDQKTGLRRNPFQVLKDIQAEFNKHAKGLEQFKFLSSVFGQADRDTIRGLSTIFQSNELLPEMQRVSHQLNSTSGAVQTDVRDTMQLLTQQAGRLKATLREAADGFAKPIDGAMAKLIKYGLDKKGLDLSGGEIIGGAAALGVGGYLATRFGGKALSRLGRGLFGTATGVAEGKALEAATGVNAVFVTNWPATLGAGGGLAGKAGKLAKLGRGAAGLALAAEAGYAAGTFINDKFVEGTSFGDRIGSWGAHVMAFFGNDEAQKAIARMNKYERLHQRQVEVGGAVHIQIDQAGRAHVDQITTKNPSVPVDVGYTTELP